MAREITAGLLRTYCQGQLTDLLPRQAFETCRMLGRLARWWLCPEVLERAKGYDSSYPELTASQPPKLTEVPGACWLLLVRTKELPLLRPAFLLPLYWKSRQEHSSDLPAELRQLADEVLKQLVKEEWGCPQWGLQLTAEVGPNDRSLGTNLGFTWSSAWAALAAGLLLAVDGLTPRRTVWATGAWDGQLADIDGLPEKLALARDWGARDFFVPAWRVKEANGLLSGQEEGLRIGALSAPVPADPQKTLNEYRACLAEQPPAPVEGTSEDQSRFELCGRYYLVQPQPLTASLRRFYRDSLLPTIIGRCRAILLAKHPSCRPSHLITIVSTNPELVLLAARTLGVRRVLLLHTVQFAEAAQQVRGWLAEKKSGSEPQEGIPALFTEERMAEEMERHIAAFMAAVPADEAAFDLTPGTKLMTLSLEKLAHRSPGGSWLFYLKHKLTNGRAEPGSEQPLCWQVGQDGP